MKHIINNNTKSTSNVEILEGSDNHTSTINTPSKKMKKIATILTLALLTLVGQMQAADNPFNLNTFLLAGSADDTRFYHSDGSTLVGSYGGYIATIWYGGLSDLPEALKPYQAAVLGDMLVGEVYGDPAEAANYAGTLQWASDPATISVEPNTTYHFSLRIFYAPELVALFDPMFDGRLNEWSKIDITTGTIQTAWDKAYADWFSGANNHEIGDFIYSVTTNSDGKVTGITEVDGSNTFLAMAASDGQFYLSAPTFADPIPEPSTWLLLGVGAAFVAVVHNRRRNA